MDIQTLITYIRRVIANPSKLLQIATSPCARGMLFHSFFEPSGYQFINSITPISHDLYDTYLHEIRNDNQFMAHLNEEYHRVRHAQLTPPQGWAELVYVIIRRLKPRIIVETGVFDGVSSAFILNALHKNKHGTLISVDLPARHVIHGSTDFMPFQRLPRNKTSGWLIPDYLRNRWKLHIINRGDELKDILSKFKTIDIFLHDSLHTNDHMMWEMKLAWQKMQRNGILLVDDIYSNDAFNTFSRSKQKKPISKYGFGVLHKY